RSRPHSSHCKHPQPHMSAPPSFHSPYAAHRDLPSFPTRRSSDLAQVHAYEHNPPGPSLGRRPAGPAGRSRAIKDAVGVDGAILVDRKSTRLNSSHQIISYAVFCLKKKKKPKHTYHSHPAHANVRK